MLEYGAFEAQTHFYELLKKVGQGEKITITLRGKPVAVLCRVDQYQYLSDRDAFERLRQLSKGAPVRASLDELQQGKQAEREASSPATWQNTDRSAGCTLPYTLR